MPDTQETPSDTPIASFGAYAVYADSMQFFATAYTMGLGFALREPDGTVLPQVLVRTSPLHAKVITMALHHQIKRYEEELGIEIAVPQKVLEELGLSLDDDWS